MRTLSAYLGRVAESWGVTKSDEQIVALSGAAKRILERCVKPGDAPGVSVQLVVGEVQSGKTASFQAVTAMARDVGFPVIFVLAGTKKILLSQTLQRFVDDFQPSDEDGRCNWVIEKSSLSKKSLQKYREVVRSFLAEPTDRGQPALILCQLKNPAGLRRVRRIIQEIEAHVGNPVPVLIIDDESDQAGLNVGTPGQPSATYAEIHRLLDSTAFLNYVMYTATPQANLLTDVDDALSPQWVTVLAPGEGYHGISQFFAAGSSFSVEIADESEFTDALQHDVVPPSLRESVLYFLLTSILLKSQPGKSIAPVSMLVHPSAYVDVHLRVAHWLSEVLTQFERALRVDAIEGLRFIVEPYLAGKVGPIPTVWSHLGRKFGSDVLAATAEPLSSLLDSSAGRLRLAVVNSTESSNLVIRQDNARFVSPQEVGDDWAAAWSMADAWILVGGNKLERGFTLKNLCVTHLARASATNVDVNQQRGRFFGYRNGYAEVCRAWMMTSTRRDFEAIRPADEVMRDVLSQLDTQNLPLSDWQRLLLVSPDLSLTRQKAISLPVVQLPLAGDWAFKQKSVVGIESVNTARALALADSLMRQARDWERDIRPNESRGSMPRHQFLTVEFRALRKILENWPCASDDAERLATFIEVFRHYEELGPQSGVDCFFMDGLRRTTPHGARQRRVYAKGTVSLHGTGLQEDVLDSSRRVPDRLVYSQNAISCQFHYVQLKSGNQPTDDYRMLLAMRWPDSMTHDILVQRTPVGGL